MMDISVHKVAIKFDDIPCETISGQYDFSANITNQSYPVKLNS